ncbi:MAG: sigma-70 family RNA polymerase sigma factor [Clostridia bacterium]|nr:sigma-70 family RNA polymerase sigma factor [Clostridia bacterium]
MDDLEIIKLYYERQEMAIDETDKKYGRLCHSISYNILGNEEDVKECVNDTYLALWNSIPPAKPKSLKAFIAKIARNNSLKKFESLHRQKRHTDMTVSLSELENVLSDSSICDNISDEHISQAINSFLKGQKESIRNVFIRKYWFFDSVESIAKRYSYSESKVKSILCRARSNLKKYLIKEGIEI